MELFGLDLAEQPIDVGGIDHSSPEVLHRLGAAGVGRAATNSVVLGSLFLILADVVLVKFILVFFP